METQKDLFSTHSACPAVWNVGGSSGCGDATGHVSILSSKDLLGQYVNLEYVLFGEFTLSM
jgi:hypothetical protein